MIMLMGSFEPDVYEICIEVYACVVSLFLLDVLIVRYSSARWLILHAFGNCVVVVCSVNDTNRTIFAPTKVVSKKFT